VDERFRKTRYRLALAMVIVLALSLRLIGIYHGYPYLDDPDEIRTMAVADNMLHRLDPVPRAYGPPAPAAIVQAAVLGGYSLWQFLWNNVSAIEDIQTTIEAGHTHPEWFLWGRAVSAFFGTVTVYLTYLLGRRFLGRRPSLMAAGLLAVCFLHVNYSALLSGEALATMLIVGSLLSIARLGEKKSWRRYIGSGVIVGLAISATPTAVLLAIPLVGAHLNRGGSLRRRPTWLVWSFVAMGAAVMLSTPRALLSPVRFSQEVVDALVLFLSTPAGSLAEGWSLRQTLQQWLVRTASFADAFGTPALVPLGGVGIWLMARRLSGKLGVLASFGIPYAIVYLYGGQWAPQALLPLMPLWALAAGEGVSWFVAPPAPPGQWMRQRFVPVMILVGASWAGLWLLYGAAVHRCGYPPAAVKHLHAGMALMVAALLLQGFASIWWERRRWRRLAVLPGVVILAVTLCLAVFMAVQIGLDTPYHWPYRVFFGVVVTAAVVLVLIQKGVGHDWSRWAVVVGAVLVLLGPNVGEYVTRFRYRHALSVDTRLQAAWTINNRFFGNKVAVMRELAVHMPTLTEVEAVEFDLYEKSPAALYRDGFTYALIGKPADPLFGQLTEIDDWAGNRLDPLGRVTRPRVELLKARRDPAYNPPRLLTNPALRLVELEPMPWRQIDLQRFVGSRPEVRYDERLHGLVLTGGDSIQGYTELPTGPAVLRLVVRAAGDARRPAGAEPIVLHIRAGEAALPERTIASDRFHAIELPYDQASRTQQLVIRAEGHRANFMVLAQVLVKEAE
jgi:4-amino-4-deoxy-L-arabinose transferase-like glycosyltransferase